MNPGETYASLGVALGVGLLIGMQRQQSAAQDDGGQRSPLGGVRTFPLVALIGALSTLFQPAFGLWPFAGAFLSVLVMLALEYVDELKRGRDRGLTTEIAFLLTFLLGALTCAAPVMGRAKERLQLAAAVGVVATALLSLKQPLHRLAERISRDDVEATLKFAVLAVVVLPLLPNQGYGPWDVLNPRKIGLMIALIAGASFLGYVALKLTGPGKGFGLTGLIGGLASSTAITLSFSGQAKREPAVATACALGVVLASTVMAGRVVAEVAVVNPALVPSLAVPMGALTVGGLASAIVLLRRSRRESAGVESLKISNPFELGSAVKFGLIFAAVLVASKAATVWLGTAGTYLAAALAGATDVDAIALSMAGMEARKEVTPTTASTGILLAAGSNTLVKAILAVTLGGWAYGLKVLVAFAVMLAAGGAGAAWLLARP